MFAEFDFDNFLLGFAFTFALAWLILPISVFETDKPTPKSARISYLFIMLILAWQSIESFRDQDGVFALTCLFLFTGLLVALLRSKYWFPY